MKFVHKTLMPMHRVNLCPIGQFPPTETTRENTTSRLGRCELVIRNNAAWYTLGEGRHRIYGYKTIAILWV